MTEDELRRRKEEMLGGGGAGRGKHWYGKDNHLVAQAIAIAARDRLPISVKEAARRCGVEPVNGFTDAAIVSIMDILNSTNWNAGVKAGKLNSMGYQFRKPYHENVPVEVNLWDAKHRAFPRGLLEHWAEMSSTERFQVCIDPTGPVAARYRAGGR